MVERPIIFSGAMVRAILAGRKTQTRRIVSPKHALGIERDGNGGCGFVHAPSCGGYCDYACASAGETLDGHVGWTPWGSRPDRWGRLWVRETWASPKVHVVAYRADGACGAFMGDGGGGRLWIAHGWIHGATDQQRDGRWWGLRNYSDRHDKDGNGRWRPAIHMPRWASRLTLEITGVRVERLQDISEDDARAEGVEPHPPSVIDDRVYRRPFEILWDQINGERAPWCSNPWLWVLSFTVARG